MVWQNEPMPWRELERKLSGRPRPPDGRRESTGDGGDSPAWSRKRAPYEPPAPSVRTGPAAVPYAELHAHSNFSFLDGASHPEEMVEQAAALGLEALALTDHDGLYGVVRFAEAAKEIGMPTLFGAELSLGLTAPQNGVADPEGTHLLVLARGPQGYGRLATAISDAHDRGREKGRPVHDLEALGAAADGHWLVLTGCRKGTVPAALASGGPGAAAAELDRLVALFGRDHLAVELWDHAQPTDSARNDALTGLAERYRLPTVATTNAHYATPSRHRLATALAAVRARRSLDDLDGWLPPSGAAHLRSGAEMAARFARHPGAVARAAALGRECAFDLSLVKPQLPHVPVGPGHDEMSWLRHLTESGARERYGPRDAEREPGAYAQLDKELAMIEQLEFPGYFLIVWEIVQFCRENDILCQGRGSAASSAVCYALRITAVDSVKFGLLFERFLSPERNEPPDIDIDIEAGRREEVIQHVYTRYGRRYAAQVANVITYRPRSAVRDMAKALGYSTGQQDAWSKQIERYGPLEGRASSHHDGGDIPAPVAELADEVMGFPRHLGIHSGGMVICDRPVVQVCPVEWARMADRTVLQWDKDDCASPLAGLVKFDLLGLGMLSALHGCFDLVREHHGRALDLDSIPKEDPGVYEMLQAADSVGVFQVESRAQMASLPRSKPETFYDLAIQVAMIRPGPIQGGSVHPYVRRRNKQEPVTYLHPSLEGCLERTLGVPMFQEQLMQMVVVAAGCTPSQADKVRRAVGSKRAAERMEALRDELYAGMAKNGITGETADTIFGQIAAFASFGFAESHAISFALLVYASAWLKRYYPAAFCAALLNAQPMGFYSPQTLVADARRHGVQVRRPDVNASGAQARLESAGGSCGSDSPAVRLGLASVRGIGDDLATRIAAGQPHADLADVTRTASPTAGQLEALATAGAFDCLGTDRRTALWAAGAVAQTGPNRLAGTVVGDVAPTLPTMTGIELTFADLWATSVTTDSHPVQHVRDRLDASGVVPIAALAQVPNRQRVRVAGVVTHRQRPGTAGGTTFINLEDETGLLNVICSRGAWARRRRVARDSAALVVGGRLERAEGVTNLIAESFERLPLTIAASSRDFR